MNIDLLNDINNQLDKLIELKKVQQARKSFYDFSKYVIGYNGKTNHLIVPHAHSDLCNMLQLSLLDVEDIGASLLGEDSTKVYYSLMNYAQGVDNLTGVEGLSVDNLPPMPPEDENGDSLGSHLQPNLVEKIKSEGVNGV